MKVTVSRHPSVPCGYLISNDEDDRTEITTTDLDFPALARDFGWDMTGTVQAEPMTFRCCHLSTDGSIDCAECGVTASDFIAAARTFLDAGPHIAENTDFFPDDEPKTVRRSCDQCNIAYINGVRCHETGCPSAWQDTTLECKECGLEFGPGYANQVVCDDCTECHLDIDGSVLNWEEADEVSDDDLEAASDFMDALEAEQSEPIYGSYTDNNPQ